MFSPWPTDWYTWERPEGVAVCAYPDYGHNLTLKNLKFLHAKRGQFWFLSVRIGKYGFYLGYKPITLEDKGFYWREHPKVKDDWLAGKKFYEFSFRITNSKGV